MSFASGPGKILSLNEESSFGTAVASGGISLDRVTSSVDLSKDTYQSNAIVRTAQIRVSRHGMRKVGGAINAELNPGAYPRIIQAHLRRDFTDGVSTGAVATIGTLASAFTRSAGNFLTDGFKIGSVVAATGFSTGTATNVNNVRCLVTGVSTGTLNVLKINGGISPSFGTNTAGDTVTLSEVGQTTYFPQSGHTDKSVTIEHFFSDLSPTQSEAFVGCKFGGMTVTMPTTGLCTVQFDVMGQDMLRATSQQLTSPSAATAASGLSSVSGVVLINGVASGIINSLNFKTDTQLATDGVVGSNVTPFVWQGVLNGTGQIVAFFQDATFRDYFVDETEISLIVLQRTGDTNTSDFMCFTLPRVKVDGATKDDKQTGGIKLTGNISFLENTAGGSGISSEATTIRIQDSLSNL